jgi:prepilin-type N-terminal cleavage/methylation domain-containing protein
MSASQSNRKIRHAGFSLVELMVSLSIFSIVMTIAMGTLLILIDANAKAQAISSAMTNLTFAIDSVTRNIRTGANYHCTSAASLNGALPTNSNVQSCTTANTAIVFTPGNASTTRVAYRLNNDRVEQRIDRTSGGSVVEGSWVPITSDVPPVQVTVDTLKFIVEGARDTSVNDFLQPRITMLIAGSVENGLKTPTPFEVQSRVTQRVLNY